MPSQHIPDLNVTNGTGFVVFARLVNDYTDGFFWFVMLLCFSIVLFASLSKFGLRQALGVTAYATFIIGVMFFITGLIAELHFMSICIIALLATFYIIASNSEA